ncbi:MAG TPA: DUF5801 repeats-in-toxin domain-containing protein [Dongiaceae bacterium]|nr:DUF5801 repeats-in-toxin domain-containing protein [Dongiaceae bacterium]
MATDSTHLLPGDTSVETDTDMANGQDFAGVQLAAASADAPIPVKLPQGAKIVVIPVKPGQTIELPTDSPDGLLAKLGADGNLAIVVDGRTIILQGYAEANAEAPIKIVTNDGDAVDINDVIVATNPDVALDIQTAAGPAAAGAQGGTDGGDAGSSGIFVPFAVGPLLGGFDPAGVLDPTALGYKTITDERILFPVLEEEEPDTEPGPLVITGGKVNEDDLPPERIILEDFIQLKAPLFGGYGGGNDPFDGSDEDENDTTVPDSTREPIEITATVAVDFGPDIPGKLALDPSLLPPDLKSQGEPISYIVVPGTDGRQLIGFVDTGLPGFDLGDRKVFELNIVEVSSTGTFHIDFKLYDSFDNEAPGSLLGANEQDLALPIHVIATDSDGTPVDGTLTVEMRDDIPFFGTAIEDGEVFIVNTGPTTIVHDETDGLDGDADDIDPAFIPLETKATGAGFFIPTSGDSSGALDGAAWKHIEVSFGADGPTIFNPNPADATARDSVYGAVSGTSENEHPFELFIANSLSNSPTDGDITVIDQLTNATVTWHDGEGNPVILPVIMRQIDAQTIVGYVDTSDIDTGEFVEAIAVQSDLAAVFVVHIDDFGNVTYEQFHQINHADDGDNSNGEYDDSEIASGQFLISAPDGTSLIYVRATDYDGDHAVQPLNIEVQDDGPDAAVAQNESGVYPIFVDESPLPFDGDGIRSVSANFSFVFDAPDYGADGPGKTEYALKLVVDGTASGLYALEPSDTKDAGGDGDGIGQGDQILLYQVDAHTIEGRVGGTTYFTITVDDDGKVTFEQLLNVWHDDTSNPDDPEVLNTLSAGDLQLVQTVTDADGDFDTAAVDLGKGVFTIEDDGPKADLIALKVDEAGDHLVVQDETALVQNGGNGSGAPDPDASGQDEDDVATRPTAFAAFEALHATLAAIGYASTIVDIDLSGGGLDPNAAYGTDGPGTTSIALTDGSGNPLNGVQSNLFDTATGDPIWLFTENGLLVGRVGVDAISAASGEVAFAVNLDSDSLEVAQYRAIQHPFNFTDDESVTLGLNGGEALIPIYATITVIDADGDAVTKQVPFTGVGGNPGIVFQDDGPTLSVTGDPVIGALSVVEASNAGGSQTVTITPPTFNATAVDGFTSSVSFALALSGPIATGLLTTIGNHPITLVVDSATQISGKYDSDGNGSLDATAFTVSLSGNQVTLTSLVALEHANNPQNTEDDTLDLGTLINVVATVTVTDGDNDQIVNSLDAVAPLSLTISDTNPVQISPDTLHLENKGIVGTTDQVTANLNFVTGADGVGNTVFNVAGVPVGVTSGVTVVATDGDGHQLSVGGQLLYLYYGGAGGTDTTILVAKTLTGTVGFTIDINPLTGTYTYDQEAAISNGTEISATNLTGVGAGNVNFKLLIDVGGSTQDVAMTTKIGDSVNSDVNDIGISGGQTFQPGEGIRFDLVNGLTLHNNNPADDTYSYDGTHNLTTRWKQTIFITGNVSQNADIIVSAIVADADNLFFTDVDEAKIDLSVANIHIYTSGGSLIDPANYAGLGISLSELGDSIQINGLTDKMSYEIVTDAAHQFSAVQIDAAATTDTFSLSFFTYGTDSAGTSIDLDYNVVGTDGDGDATNGTIDVSLYPDATSSSGTSFAGTSGNDTFLGTQGVNTISGADGNDLLAGNADNDTINGGSGNDTIIGGSGNDNLSGGAGSDTYVYETLVDGKDSISDFDSLASGDKLDISQVLNHAGNTWTDGNTIVDAIAGGFVTFTDGGGGNVQVNVDIDGSGTAYTATAVAVLTTVTLVNAQAGVLNDNIVLD